MLAVYEREARLLGASGRDLVVPELAALPVVAYAFQLITFAQYVLLLSVGALLQLLEAVCERTLVPVRARVELQPAVANFGFCSLRLLHGVVILQ